MDWLGDFCAVRAGGCARTVNTTMRNAVFYAVNVERLQAEQSLELSVLWDIHRTVTT
jgi:hypothetical protein